jgi:hypothetical protein
MFTIDEMLAPFHPISLEKMDEVKLLDRMDTKFVFNAVKLPDILNQLHSAYHVLEIGQVRLQKYETQYFDTPGNLCYLQHHNKRLSRFKVRTRRYADSGLCYFEIKSKNNKGRTSKERRKQMGLQDEISEKSARFLTSATGLTPSQLRPSIRVDFSRITLVNNELTERITLDSGLTFRDEAAESGFPGIIIAEIKQNRSGASRFQSVLHQAHIQEFRISKYCLGMISLNPDIKQNNFKEKLHYIIKTSHDIR